MGKAKKETDTRSVEVGSDTVRMKFATEKQSKECRSISVEGFQYTRESDGSFIVSREHIPAMRNQGLVFAD
jgi:hypothetical protein